MANSILVLHFETSATPSHDDYKQFFSRLDQGLPVSVVSPDDLVFILSNDSIELNVGSELIPIQSFSHLIARGSVDKHRDIVLPVVEVAQLFGLICWNGAGGSFVRSKLAQNVQMQRLGLPIPKTVFCMNRTMLMNAINTYIGYPCIIKDWKGSHGNDNYLIKSHEHLEEVLFGADEQINFIAQEHIPNDGDYRYLNIGNEELLIHRSTLPGSHLSNTSQGGVAKIVDRTEVDQAVLGQANDYANKYEMTIYGADIIKHTQTQDYYFLEFNSQPQILTGAFLDEKREMMRKAILDTPPTL